jgi:hypothetical protein
LEFARRLREGQIGPQIGDHPLAKGCEQPRWFTWALCANGRRRRVPSRDCGSATSMSPKVLCQGSFFALAPHPRGPIQFLRPLADRPVRPVLQHLLAEPTHLLDHAPFRLVGFAQVIPRILNQVDQTFDATTQLRVFVQAGQQPLVFGGQRSTPVRYSLLQKVTAVF